MNKRKILKKIGLILLLIFIAIQFIPTNRNQSTEILASDFIKTYNPPTHIANKLKVSCYDCHSNNTYYPWYNKIQPVAWFLENHINEAKEELNFSEFGNYSNRKKKGKLKSIRNEIKDDKMPLKSYTIMHKDAKFTEEEKKQFVKYFNKIRD
jgi:hypothetical protein